MIVEIQCLPTPAGTPDDPHATVEAAIAVITDSGLHYEVGPLGTTVEGEPDDVWPVLRRAHEACLEAGATTAIAMVKIAEMAGPQAKSMDELTRKFRP
ncbi:MAG: thiamine-binding protein [Mycobacteriales bacterium]|nr:MAG: hypothetical protein DLM56_09360 [Pseudonocardiales bacterium]